MYNDYYLQQIYGELAILEDIEENQETIIQQNIILQSGDREIIQQIASNTQVMAMGVIILVLTLLYSFVVRCLK